MKKIFSIVCAGALMTLATACGGNKAANDSETIAADSIVGVEMEETIVEEESVVAPAEEINEAAAESKAVNGAKKTATKASNKAKDAADKAVDKATDKAKAAVQATKEVAKTAAKDAKESEKAKALREKMQNRNKE